MGLDSWRVDGVGWRKIDRTASRGTKALLGPAPLTQWTTSALAEESALPRSVTAGVDQPVKVVFSDLALTARIVLDDDRLLCIGMLGVRVRLKLQDDPTVLLSIGDPDVPHLDVFQFPDLRSLIPQVAGQRWDPECESFQAPNG